jgi:HK97 family phage major capsid protein
MENFAEVKKLVDELGKSVHDMRQNNEEKMAELAKNNGVAELKAAQEKLDEQVANMVKGLTDLQRANALGADNQKSNDDVAPEIKAAFSHLVRRGEGGLDAKSLSSLTNPDGGYLVPRDTSGRIIKKAQDYSPMRRYASVQSISGDALEGLNDNGVISTGWVGETASRTATATTQLGMWKVPAHEIYANPQATQRMLDDAEINVEAWISGKLAEAFGQAEASAFISGDGVGKPRGILSRTFATTTDASRAWGTVQKVASGASGAFVATPNAADCLISLMTALHPKYWAGAIFAMNRYTLGEVMKLKDDTGAYIWQPNFQLGVAGTILGQKVDASFDHLPSLGAASKSIVFGDFSNAYQIVDKKGITILRDPLTNKPYVGFYTTRRVGGDVINSEAYKVLSFEA